MEGRGAAGTGCSPLPSECKNVPFSVSGDLGTGGMLRVRPSSVSTGTPTSGPTTSGDREEEP